MPTRHVFIPHRNEIGVRTTGTEVSNNAPILGRGIGKGHINHATKGHINHATKGHINHATKQVKKGGTKVSEATRAPRKQPAPTKISNDNKTKNVPKKDKSLEEIRKYQRSTDCIIPLAAFKRLVVDIVKELWKLYSKKPDVRIQRDAILALREQGEMYLVKLFESSNLAAIHAKRITIFRKDMLLVQRIREQSGQPQLKPILDKNFNHI
jgi:histone H3